MAPPPRRRMMMTDSDDEEDLAFETPQGSTASSSRSTSRARRPSGGAQEGRQGGTGHRTALPSTRIGRPVQETRETRSQQFGSQRNPIQVDDDDEDDDEDDGLIDLDNDGQEEEDMDVDEELDESAFNLSGGAAFPVPRAWRNPLTGGSSRFGSNPAARSARSANMRAPPNPYAQYPATMGGLFNGGMGGMMGMGMGMGMGGGLASGGIYEQSFRAFSMAMMDAAERVNVSYGGKIIMPQSALATLSALEFESPMLFQLRNPSTDEEGNHRMTHGGVLEFIAEEGRVYLPGWMMRGLGLDEGDPIAIKGASLPKGKLIKIQPQTVDFLEISDPKAVLEQALRNYSTLTKGDIIEINYNSLTFEILVMEVEPDSDRAMSGISITETDLEVDFAAPKGYVEPAKPEPKPVPTMASKMGIDTRARDSRPTSSLGGNSAFVSGTSTPSSFLSGGGAFRGGGNTLSGRTLEGAGVKADEGGQEIESMDPLSKASRTSGRPKVIKPEQLNDRSAANGGAAAALRLPFGTLFFGYDHVPPKGKSARDADESTSPSFQGQANKLRGGPS